MNAIIHDSKSTFGVSRRRELNSDLFARLMKSSAVYGVTPEFVSKELSLVTRSELSDALSKLLTDPKQLKQIADQSSYHPNGFLKLQLSVLPYAKLRLHYWPSSMLSAEENIHNHRWRLASKVMIGQLYSELFVETSPTDSKAEQLEMRLYHKEQGAHQANEVHCGVQSVRCSETIIRHEGEAYAMDTHQMHRIIHSGESPTVTLMVQSAPIFQENYMLSSPLVVPELSPRKLEGPEELRDILVELINLLHED